MSNERKEPRVPDAARCTNYLNPRKAAVRPVSTLIDGEAQAAVRFPESGHSQRSTASLVTFSLGSGMAGDVIMSFVADICGEASEEDKPPKHAHAFGQVGRLHKQIHEERVAALGAFHAEVTAQNFPYAETNIAMHPGEQEKFLEALDKWSPTHK